MTILITGAKGFVGNKIFTTCSGTAASPSLRGVTQTDIDRIIDASGADVIVHTAAISDMGACAADPEASYKANVDLPVMLAKACRGRKLICFSSDQVYNSCEKGGPYTEDTVNPGNTYSRHKLEMEQRVLDIDPDAVMLRAEWMYDFGAVRANYMSLVLNADELRFSTREYRGVTYVKEVADNIANVIKLPGGAYNYGSETDRSIYEITREFAEYIGKDINLSDSPPGHNLWMDCSKARKYGVVFSNVLDGLKKCADDYGLSILPPPMTQPSLS